MLKNLAIGKRLGLLLGVMSFAFLLITLMGIFGIQTAVTGIHEVYYGGIDSVEFLEGVSHSYRVDILGTVQKVNNGELNWSEGLRKIKTAQNAIKTQWEEYLKTDTKAESKALRITTREAMDSLDATLVKISEIFAAESREQLNTYATKTLPLQIDVVLAQIERLSHAHITETMQDYQDALSNARITTIIMLFASAIVIGLAILFALLIARSITVPLNKIVTAVDQLALGICPIFDKPNNDEVGSLIKSMQTMNQSTEKMVCTLAKVAQGNLTVDIPMRSDNDVLGKAIGDTVERLKNTLGKLQEEVAVLTSSAQEVAASVTQVTSGTAETASAVTETTTTMEELKQTAQVSSEKAKDVLSNADSTLGIVNTSEKTVRNTIEDMAQIQEKMRVISESIVKLSEHSLTIGQIIDTVNDLAEQSNLLAVNAAIEAAKAGEQGKSFSVVAQEIRALAEQSKAATVHVRAILNDIQNATSSAVMATEQGSKAVTKGVAQSAQTTTAIQSVSESMKEVALSAKQISISSEQQLVGVDQVRLAMSNINESTGQHVNHMKQIETAVSTLNDVGSTIKELISQYKLK